MLVVCFDTETTGLDVKESRIVEIALVAWDTATNAERLAFRRLVNPGIHIPAATVAIHGITDADVAKAPPFSAIAGGVVALLSRADLLIGHNIARYDVPLLGHELARVGVPMPALPPVIDTMLEGRWATDNGQIPNLGALCWATDVPYDPEQAHGALYDVRVNLQAFLKGVDLGVWALPEAARAAA